MVACIRNYQPFPAPHAYERVTKAVSPVLRVVTTAPKPKLTYKTGRTALLEVLTRIADEGAPLPTNLRLADLSGLCSGGINKAISALQTSHLITINMAGNKMSSVTIRSTGKRTGPKLPGRAGRRVTL